MYGPVEQVVSVLNYVSNVTVPNASGLAHLRRSVRMLVAKGPSGLPFLTPLSDIQSHNGLFPLALPPEHLEKIDSQIDGYHGRISGYLEARKGLVKQLGAEDREHAFWIKTKVSVGSIISMFSRSFESPPTPAPTSASTKGVVCSSRGCMNHSSLKACSGCKAVYYCGVFCQKTDWPEHKARCKEIQARGAAKP